MSRTYRRPAPATSPALWLALLAVVFHSLMPSLAWAAGAHGTRVTVALCSAHGGQPAIVVLDLPASPASKAIPDCPCCDSGLCNLLPLPALAPKLAPVLPPSNPVAFVRPVGEPVAPDAVRRWFSRRHQDPPPLS